MQLDTRLPLAAVGERINPAGIMQQAAKFRQQQQTNALQQRLEELKASRDAETLDRRQRAGRRVYSQMQQAEQGTPAQYEPVPMNQGPVINQPAYGQMRESSPAVPGREMSPDEINREMARALFAEGDYEGAFEAMKAARTGQASQAKPFGAETKRGPDGMEYALNMMTGRYEPTGFAAERDPAKPRIRIVRTARGIEVVDLNNLPPGTVLPPEKKPEAKRAPRTQVVTDETGTFVIDLDNPSAPAVPVTKPGGAQITKPKASQEPSTDESKNAGFYLRMSGVGKSLDDFEKTGAPTVMTSMASSLPFVGGYAQRKSMTEDQQQYYTAAMAWIRAKLRKESGAVIGDDEAKSEWATYFPMPGDTKANIEQKKQLRKMAEDEMRLSAGRAAGKVDAAGQKRQRSVSIAVQWLKSRTIKSQEQFNAEIRALRKQGWTEEEVRQAIQEAGL